MSAKPIVEPNAATIAFINKKQRIFINGVFVEAHSHDVVDVFNPATGKVLSQVPDSDAVDVDRAVKAAKAALAGSWSKIRPADRERLLLKLADLVEANAEDFAQIETLNNGKGIEMSRALEAGAAPEFLRYMAGWATKIEGSTLDNSIAFPPGSAYFTCTVREPVGVVGAIIPWNFPLTMAVWKLGPALACGCSIVLKPAEETPLTALYLAELVAEAGFPAGVVNVVTGRGETTGVALSRHPAVNKLVFTGSTQVGRLIGHAAVDNLARFTLELGGKSPMVVFSDVEAGLEPLMANVGMFLNQGQICAAATRVLIDKSIYDKTLDAFAKVAASLSIGPGLDPNANINPVVSAKQRERVLGYLSRAEKAGAKQMGAERRVPDQGYYVAPRLVYDVDQRMEIVQNEIFGPVIAAMPFSTEEEAIQLANDTRYGLAASIWTRDINKALRVTKAMRAGTVWVNMHNVIDPNLPFGGMKESGIGREHGRGGLDNYLETKTITMRYQT